MAITDHEIRQVLLISLALLIAPMVAFPEQFGMSLSQSILTGLVLEVLYYSAVIYIFNRETTLVKLLKMSGFCLAYRLVLGTLFGLLIAVMYSMHMSISFRLGVISYLPGLIFHAALTPFVLKPLIDYLYRPTSRRFDVKIPDPVIPSEKPKIKASTPEKTVTTRPSPAISSRETSPPPQFQPQPRLRPPRRKVERTVPETNGFDKATRYIGEDGSVQMATIVDAEGLLLSKFERGNIDAEDWAPFSLLFFDNARDILIRTDLEAPEKIDMVVKDRRVVLSRNDSLCLMVVAERGNDELLNVRVAQAMDIVGKYISERYGQMPADKVEIEHVRSTQ